MVDARNGGAIDSFIEDPAKTTCPTCGSGTRELHYLDDGKNWCRDAWHDVPTPDRRRLLDRLDPQLVHRTSSQAPPLGGAPVRDHPHEKGNQNMNVRPIHDRILVKRLEADNKSPGGIIIPDAAKEKPVEGLVVAVGSGKRDKDGALIPLDVKAGDRILFSKYSGSEVKVALDGGEHLILREDDVLAVIG